MSSFPQHEDNIKALANMGFDVSMTLDGGEVTLKSWGYDELVDLMSSIIVELKARGVGENYVNEA